MVSYPLIIDGTAPTEAEFVALWQLVQGRRQGTWKVGLVLALLVGFMVYDVLTRRPLSDYYTAIALLVGVVIIYAARGPYVRWQTRRTYARTPRLRTPTRYELSPAGLRCEPSAKEPDGELSPLEIPWADLVKAQLQGPWLLVYISEITCYYLDLRHLQPPATEADVLALLQAEGVAMKS